MSSPPSEFDPVEELADSFLERYRRGERPSLSEYAREHPELAEQIRELFPLLVAVERVGSMDSAADSRVKGEAWSLPRQLGEYRILREIGRGGMGVVYEAVQESLGRHVALKVLPYHGLLNSARVARFRREARAVARLHHTNIVPVFVVGVHEGIQYYAMQFIHGQGLNEVLHAVKRLHGAKASSPPDQGLATSVAENLVSGHFAECEFALPLARSGQAEEGTGVAGTPLEERKAPSPSHSHLTTQPEAQYYRSVAQIGVQVAEALDYAHGERVLHRDIKPSNLLLDIHGRVWVTDFGLAKADETEEFSDPGDIVGTLCYMAPERFQGQADARSDVYGLGLTLYELATLEAAFADSQRARLIERVTREEPRRPRELDPKIPRDLETIILKAIAKDPGQRYATARALADDLYRFLADRPVCARRSLLWQRAWRWCRRNPALAALIATVVFFVTVIAVFSMLSASWLRAEANRARRAEQNATEELWQSYYAQAQASRWSGRPGQRFKSLAALKKAAQIAHALNLGGQQFLDLRNEAIASLLLPDVRIAKEWHGYPAGSAALTFDASFERYALSDRQGVIHLYRTSDARELIRLPGSGNAVSDLRFSPDGRYLAVSHASQEIGIWDLAQGRLLFQTPPCASEACLDWGPGSDWVAVGLRDFSIGVYAVPSGKETTHLAPSIPGDRIALNPSGRRVASSGWGSNVVEVRDLLTGTSLYYLDHPRVVQGLCWSPDGRFLACGCSDSEIYVWDLTAQGQKTVLRGHQAGVRAVTFSHNGDLLASQGWDGTLRLWNPRTGHQLLSSPGAGYSLQFSPDDTLLGGIVKDSDIVFLEIATGAECRSLDTGVSGRVWMNGLDFSPDGRLLASASDDGVRLWDVAAPRNVVRLAPNRYGSVLFQSDGSGILAWGDAELRRWPIQIDSANEVSGIRAEPRWKIGPDQTLLRRAKLGAADKACWAADGRSLLLTDRSDSQALVINVEEPREKTVLRAHNNIGDISISPDSKWIATGSAKQLRAPGPQSHGVRVWDARSRQPIKDLLAESACVAFSPDGGWLVTGTVAEYCFWQVGSWQAGLRFPRTDASFPGSLAFTRDGKLLALAASDRTIQVIDLATRSQLATFSAPEPNLILWLRFNPEGDQLAAATQDNLIQLWDLRRLREQLAAVDLDWQGTPYLPRSGSNVLAPLALEIMPSDPSRRLEAETLKIVDHNDTDTGKQDMEIWDHSQWSHGRQLFSYAREGGFVELEVDVPRAGNYHLDVYFTQAEDYGIVQVSIDGKKVGNRFDGFYGRVVPSGRVDFGVVSLSEGQHRLRFTIVGKNPASLSYNMGIDCLELKPLN